LRVATVAATGENRGICPGCSQMVTTAHPRTVDETTKAYWHRPCYDAKEKAATDGVKAGPAEDRGLCPVCNLMVTTAHPRTVDEPTGKYYHRSCFEEKDKVAAAEAAEAEAAEGEDGGDGEDGEADGAEADDDASKPGKKRKCSVDGCKKSAYKNEMCAQHFRERSGFTTVNFAKMMGGDTTMDMKLMTKNYKAMTMKMSKKGPVIGGKGKAPAAAGGAKTKGMGNAMIPPSKKFLEQKEAEAAGGGAEETPPAAATSPDFVQCRMCDENEPVHAATTRCQDCEEDMCDVIARAHQRAKMSKSHTLILLADLKKGEGGATAGGEQPAAAAAT